MRFSTKSQYGLRALVLLAKNQKVLSLKEISQKEGIPFDYLEKIFSKLKKAKIVGAKKGIGGGYFLRKKPEKIKLSEIILTLERDDPFVKCLKGYCPKSKSCLTKNFWHNLNKAIRSFLNSLTLADLIKK